MKSRAEAQEGQEEKRRVGCRGESKNPERHQGAPKRGCEGCKEEDTHSREETGSLTYGTACLDTEGQTMSWRGLRGSRPRADNYPKYSASDWYMTSTCSTHRFQTCFGVFCLCRNQDSLTIKPFINTTSTGQQLYIYRANISI